LIKLKPFFSRKIWGYEKWTVSTHPAGLSLPRIGYDYPLLVKIIRANETLSVQVHPDDEYARIHENSRGKTECWYVLDAKQNSSIICGLSGTYSADELRSAISENRLEPYLHSVPVKKGDFVFIPAGLVHAIKGGLRLLEVQQSSDITYRLYDWGRGREVHIEKGLEVLKDIQPQVIRKFAGRFDCPYFTLEIVEGEAVIPTQSPAKVSAKFPTKNDYALFALKGNGELAGDDGVKLAVRKNDTVFCKASEKVHIPQGLTVMFITPREDV
jgi:mannose-6-phosphate isomerase